MPTPTSQPAPRHPFLTWLNRPDQLARTLVGRDALLEALLHGIAATGRGGPANHVLLVGPRGIGKTHILSLLDHYASGQLQPPESFKDALAGWVPVFFSEEEYAGQSSLANFLLTAILKLREALPQEDLWRLPPDLPAQGDAAVRECCFERIRRFHAERGNRLLLLVDNLQRILRQWPSDDHDSLRAFLSGQGFVLLIGTAPSVFREVLSQRAAFHQFFDIQVLRDLSEEEMLELLRRLYCEDGREADFAARRQELGRKLPAIMALTGGNPRLVLFLYEVATRSTFLEIESALSELLESLHDYFLQRFDKLADQPRKVLDTIAQMPGPATPTEIAGAARLPIAIINAQLRRLKADHYVQIVKFQRQRSTRYDITERLFRIWRQTATVAGRRRFRFLTDFLKLYFTPAEVRSLYLNHAACIAPGLGADREEVIRHVEELYYLQAASESQTRAEIFATRIRALLDLGEAAWASEETDHMEVESRASLDIAGLESAVVSRLALWERSLKDVLAATGGMLEAIDMLLQVGGYEHAIQAAQHVAESTPGLMESFSELVSKAEARGEQELALKASSDASELGKLSSSIFERQAEALNRLKRNSEALPIAEKALAFDPQNAQAWRELGLAASFLGDHHRALASFRKAAEVGEPSARLLALQAVALDKLGRPEAALEALERAVELEPRRADLALAKALILNDLRRADEALACVAVAEENGASPEIAHQVRGDILALGGRYEEAARSLDAGLSVKPDDWDMAADREIALACLGRHGPRMEALPGALSRISIPTGAERGVLEWELKISARALERGEVSVCEGLLNAVTSMASWRSCEWFAPQVGALLRRVLHIRPQEFLAAMEIVRQNVTEEDVLRLLEPFLQAAEFVRTRDLRLLERLFPEVRGLVLDIVHRVAPELDDLVRPAR